MNTTTKIVSSFGALLLLGGCVSMPSGPGVTVLPGTGKSFDQFRADDSECRQFASSQVGGNTPNSVAEDSAVKSAVVGTAVGALAGAIIGGHQGAAAGAGAGLIIGGASGAGAAQGSQRYLQQRYDAGYQQCMYAKGHRVPVAGRYDYGAARRPMATSSNYAPPPPENAPPPPPTAGAFPPPPPGAPPPPPPGVK